MKVLFLITARGGSKGVCHAVAVELRAGRQTIVAALGGNPSINNIDRPAYRATDIEQGCGPLDHLDLFADKGIDGDRVIDRHGRYIL